MNSFVIARQSFWYQSFSKALKLTEIEANQTEVCILLRAEMVENGAKANFVNMGEKNLLKISY